MSEKQKIIDMLDKQYGKDRLPACGWALSLCHNISTQKINYGGVSAYYCDNHAEAMKSLIIGKQALSRA